MSAVEKDRRSNMAHSSVNAPAKKGGAGGQFTWGRADDVQDYESHGVQGETKVSTGPAISADAPQIGQTSEVPRNDSQNFPKLGSVSDTAVKSKQLQPSSEEQASVMLEAVKTFEPDLGQCAEQLKRNPIRSVVMAALAKKKRGEECIMLAGGRPIAEKFPEICGGSENYDLMNYGSHLAAGNKDLTAWAEAFVQEQHAPPGDWQRHSLIITPGNTHSITMAVLCCTDVGEAVLCDEFSYTGILVSSRALGRRPVGIPMDAGGMIPSELRKVAQAIAMEKGGRAPRLLYLVPNGLNPTAVTMSAERRREIYKVAQECNLLILEDDPYCFLDLGSDTATSQDDMPGLVRDPRGSFLSLDVDGRVIRLDSCSKFLAPGFRIGWLVGPKVIVQKLSVMGEVLTWCISGFTQQALLQCVQGLGREGLHKHLQQLQWAYRQRRDICVKAFDRHLTGLAGWDVPTDGMFLWMEVKNVPNACSLAEALVERGVAMVPGSAFRATEETLPCSHFRVSFTMLSEATAEQAAKNLAAALKDAEFLAAHCKKAELNGTANGQHPAKQERGMAAGVVSSSAVMYTVFAMTAASILLLGLRRR